MTTIILIEVFIILSAWAYDFIKSEYQDLNDIEDQIKNL